MKCSHRQFFAEISDHRVEIVQMFFAKKCRAQIGILGFTALISDRGAPVRQMWATLRYAAS